MTSNAACWNSCAGRTSDSAEMQVSLKTPFDAPVQQQKRAIACVPPMT